MRIKIVARAISILLHPLIIPTIGFLMLVNSGFYFSLISFEGKKFLLLIVFLTTFLAPLLCIGLLSLNPRFNPAMDRHTDRLIPLLCTAICYYVGYYWLGRIQAYPVYRIFLIAAVLTIILLMLVTTYWKISAHMAGIGGLAGAIIALSLRLDTNASLLIAGLVMLAGLLGSSRLLLAKHTPAQIYTGFLTGFLVQFLVISFI